MVHCLEKPIIQVCCTATLIREWAIDINIRMLNINNVHIIQCHLYSSFGSTHHNTTSVRIVRRRTKQLHHSWTIHFDEFITGYFLININPYIFHHFGQSYRLIIVCRNQVKLHVRFLIIISIIKTDIIGRYIVLHQPIVEFIHFRLFRIKNTL